MRKPVGSRVAAAVAAACLAACASAAACSRGAASPDPGGAPSRRIGVAFAAEGRAPAGSRGPLGDSVFAALAREAAERGGRVLEGRPEDSARGRVRGLDILCLDSRLGGEDGEQMLRSLAEDGPDLVIAVGSGLAGGAARAARDFPKVRFALVGAPYSYRDDAPNLASVSFELGEGAFLAGAIAGLALADEDDPLLGFLAASDTPESEAIEAAFRAGAATTSPALRKAGRVLAYYCGRLGGPDPQVVKKAEAALAARRAATVFRTGLDGTHALSRGAVPLAAVEARGGAAARSLVDELVGTGTVRAGPRSLGLAEGALGCPLAPGGLEAVGRRASEFDSICDSIAAGRIPIPRDERSAAEYIGSLK